MSPSKIDSLIPETVCRLIEMTKETPPTITYKELGKKIGVSARDR